MSNSPLDRPLRECPFAEVLASRLRENRDMLVNRWLDRICARVTLPQNRVFPTEELRDHIPLLVDGIAEYLEHAEAEVSADMPVVAKAIELGELRHRQGFDAYEIMKEYEILGGILFYFLAGAADEIPEPCEKSELLVCGHRLFRAISIIQETTTTRYLRIADTKIAEREDRLRAFGRTISHEMKNHVGVILGAADMLVMEEMDPAERPQFHGKIAEHARAMKGTLDNLVHLSRLENDARQHRNVRLPQAAAEACRQVREAARAANVEVRAADDLPDVEVNATIVELALTNYLSNAIKYSAPNASASYAEITGALRTGANGNEIVVCVRDNGLGVPPEKRARLFERFYRAHESVTGAEGTGLGLSIVRETVEPVGGKAWAEFPESGSTFCFSLPMRRDEGPDRRSQ